MGTSVIDMATQSVVLSFDSREQWLEARRQGIGSSDAAAILGESQWASPFSVWAEKTHGASAPNESEYTHWGTILEAPIREEYQRRTGRLVSYAGPFSIHRSADVPWLQASLDGTIETCGDVLVRGVYEGKTTAGFNADEWADEPPLQYQIQVQHQMAVTGMQWASIACLIGGHKLVYFDIERNQRFIDAMMERLAAFWRCVESATPPPVDASPATTKALRLLHPADNGQTIELPAAAGAKWLERKMISDEIKTLEARRDEIDNWFRAAIGDNTYGTLGGETWTMKTQDRAEHVVRASSYRVLRKAKGGGK